MVKKLMLVTSLLAFSSTIVSTAEAMDSEDNENQNFVTPQKRETKEPSSFGAPAKKKRYRNGHADEDVIRRLDFNVIDPALNIIDYDDDTD
jgi:hypothetical protein